MVTYRYVAIDNWDWRYPVELQDVPWDCAAASLTWALNALGYPTTEAEVVAGLGPDRISPQYGLLDASGAGLVAYLAEIGFPAMNNSNASWAEIMAAAGHQPMVMGGREWCHWTGVRMGSATIGYPAADIILLANPSPGYYDVSQMMLRGDFDTLGPFSAVWFPA